MPLDQDLDCVADTLAERLGKVRLPFPGVANGFQDSRGGILLGRCPKLRLQQGTQGVDLRREFSVLEPQVQVPLAPGLVVEAGEE